jgi:hypothetical protein
VLLDPSTIELAVIGVRDVNCKAIVLCILLCCILTMYGMVLSFGSAGLVSRYSGIASALLIVMRCVSCVHDLWSAGAGMFGMHQESDCRLHDFIRFIQTHNSKASSCKCQQSRLQLFLLRVAVDMP